MSTLFVDSTKKARRDLNSLLAEPGVACALDTEFDTNERDDKDLVIWSRSRRRAERVVILAEFATSVYAEWLQDPKFPKIWSDYRADEPVFRKIGLDLNPSFGADIVHTDVYCDENEKRHGLKPQCLRRLKIKREDYAQLFKYVPEGKKKAIVIKPGEIMGSKPFPAEALKVHSQEKWKQILIEYSADDGEHTILCFQHARYGYLEKIGYWPNYLKIDRPFTITLRAMQPRGMLIDKQNMYRVRGLARQDMMRSERLFKSVTDAPEDINIGSKDQLRKHLVENLAWPEYEDMRTEKKDEQQMTEAALKRWLSDGYIPAQLIIDWNKRRKLISDVTSLLKGVSDDNRIRSDWKQLGTTSMRLASRKWKETKTFTKVSKKGVVKTTYKKTQVGANLQNVVTKEDKDPYGIRKGFVAPKAGQMTADGTIAEEDYSLIVADEAGFEIVLCAHWIAGLTDDSPTVRLINKYGTASVVHVDTAINIFKLPVTVDEWMKDPKAFKDKYKKQYDLSKIGNFSLQYLGTEYTLVQKRGQDVRNKEHLEENRLFVDQWRKAKPDVVLYQRWAVKHGYKHGWVPTLAGARQHVAEGLKSHEDWVRRHWESKCTNGPIQPSGAQILMVAMNAIERDEELRALGYRMTAQVHDETVGECPTRTAPRARELVIGHMERPFKDILRVPLGVEATIVDNWAEK